MSWTETARRDHARRGLRYSSDLTDREWALISPFLPEPRALGRPRTTDLREVVNALLYLASSGCAWSLLPRDFPPFTTVQRYFYDWRDRGVLKTISHLVTAAREVEGREASPTAGVIDSLASRPPKAAVFAASTPARGSRVASATSAPTHLAIWSGSSSTALIFRIETGPSVSWPRSATAIPGCVMSSPMVGTAATS